MTWTVRRSSYAERSLRLGLTRVENDPSRVLDGEDQYHRRQWTRQCVFTYRLSRRVARG
jgi:hypothetical protein